MKTQSITVSALALMGFFAACNAAHPYNKQSESSDKAMAITLTPPVPGQAGYNAPTYSWTSRDSVFTMMSSSAAQGGKDSTRRFIRTADLRFRVKNAVKASYSIEDITRHFNGIVTYTHLYSDVERTTTIPVSEDSSLETTYYTMINTIVMRVPNSELDTTLKCIAPLVDFMDYRYIKANNVSLKLFAKRLEQDRLERHNARLAKQVDNTKTKKLSDVTDAENDMLAKDEMKDNAMLDNLRTEDSIKYSAITIYLYQRQSLKRELIANDKNINAYEPGFGYKFVSAIKFGWNIIVQLVLFFANIWTLILLLVLGVYLYYKYAGKINNPKS